MRIIEKDIFDKSNDLNVIVHCCNCQNTMGSGIALQIKKKYPAAFEADTNVYEYYRHSGIPKQQLGKASFAKVDSDLWIVNLYGQYYYGVGEKQIDYEGFYQGLLSAKGIIEKIRKENFFDKLNVGFPYKIGSDRAGGDWNIVSAMIASVFGNAPGIETSIYKLPNSPD